MMGKSRKRKADESEIKEDKKTLKKHKKEKKDKKEKKERKKGKERTRRTKKDKRQEDKKDKKTRRKEDKIRTGSDETLVSKESSATPPPIATRLSARSKWIKQKGISDGFKSIETKFS